MATTAENETMDTSANSPADTSATADGTAETINMEMLPFQIIANVGTARSMYVEAVEEAERGNIEGARAMITEGEQCFVEGHDAHLKLFSRELGPDDVKYLPLIIHAEDQLMSAETMKIVCEKFIDMQEELQSLKA
ncbi:PTS lactose/cellobiose transporter subunit IIA [Collinsella sp. An2]|uniref:PTS lactose/cellobiose transporter subunit IIA n=1 Tax=Collinsella sp. An2 TaxID=1965585 RepID=UPI001EF4F6D4|nr:PTS lactose/cellobiose transporter subunit IIA [Collinsella sp. An2]